MKALFAVAAAIMLSAPSALEHGLIYAGMPPVRFQGDSTGTVAYVTDIGAHCGSIPNAVIFACTITRRGRTVTYLPNPCLIGEAEWFALLSCHEASHRQGWGARHEY